MLAFRSAWLNTKTDSRSKLVSFMASSFRFVVGLGGNGPAILLAVFQVVEHGLFGGCIVNHAINLVEIVLGTHFRSRKIILPYSPLKQVI